MGLPLRSLLFTACAARVNVASARDAPEDGIAVPPRL